MKTESQNFERAESADAPQEHPLKLAKQVSRDNFEALLLMLGASTHVDVVQLFVGRVPYHTVIDWRRGKATIPRWAYAYLATLCRERASVFLNGAALGDNPPDIPRGQGSHRNIVAWNKRRAALAAKKKEPAA